MFVSDKWREYQLIDAANGERLERWGEVTLIRPDPQIIWQQKSNPTAWNLADAHYHRSKAGGGHWEFFKKLPESWKISYKNLTFSVRPTGFKHTGLFPEQAANWDFIADKISSAQREISMLNLFAYTGGASIAAAKAGARVVHVDAAKGMVSWAKSNAELCGLKDAPIRYIVDDAVKFVAREIRRGNKYDCIIMDPPTYGRGPDGEVWRFDDEFYALAENCTKILSENPLFFVVNSYTSSVSSTVVANVLRQLVEKKFGGHTYGGEICLPVTASNMLLPCGAATRWESKREN